MRYGVTVYGGIRTVDTTHKNQATQNMRLHNINGDDRDYCYRWGGGGGMQPFFLIPSQSGAGSGIEAKGKGHAFL